MRPFLGLLMMLISSVALAAESAKELRCLAKNVYFEARGEPLFGQLAVALVTMNRVQSKRYPNSVCRVVWQRRQFSWTHDGKSDKPTDKGAWNQAMEIAKFILHKYTQLPERARAAVDITNGALYYYAPKIVEPYWARQKVVTTELGGHIFLMPNS